MKTLREHLDQLDEISRRDFLKGAGATAGLAAIGAPKDAKSQNIDYNAWANYAVNQAITALRKFKSVLISPQRINFEEVVKNAVTRSINWYMSSTNAYNLEKVINEVTAIAYNAADREGIGIGDLIGGEVTDNIAVKATNTFARSYVAAVEQKANEYKQTVGQQQQQNLHPIYTKPYDELNMALTYYYFAKEFDPSKVPAMQAELGKYIRATNEKELVNAGYRLIQAELEKIKDSNPQRYKELSASYLPHGQYYIDLLRKVVAKKEPEFKEDVDEAATPDAVARVLELSKYK